MTCSRALKKLTCACSLLLLATVAFGSDLTEFRARVEAAETPEQLAEAARSAPERLWQDESVKRFIDDGAIEPVLLHNASIEQSKARILAVVDARIAVESVGRDGKVSDAKATASEILENPLYTDRREREGRNWLDNAATRIGDRLWEWLRNLFRGSEPASISLGPSPALGGLTVIAWFLLGAAVLLIVYFVVLNFKGVGRRRRRVGGILEDDEPERTADQWLLQAEKLEGEGRYREAVRCLYIACLVRYDDGRVARFRRHETNWEHLYRIEASPQNPSEIDFRTSTQKFDKIWYGGRVKGQEDVTEFKEVYKRLCLALQIPIAA